MNVYIEFINNLYLKVCYARNKIGKRVILCGSYGKRYECGGR